MEFIQKFFEAFTKSFPLPPEIKLAQIYVHLENLESLSRQLDASEITRQIQVSIVSLKKEIESFCT